MNSKITRTIVAIEQDGLETRVLALNFVVPNKEFKLRAAISAACTEFCQSESGRKVYEGNCRCFNWGDFDTYVPAELCEKYGFTKVPAEVTDDVVAFDEQLVDETEVSYEPTDGMHLHMVYLFPAIEGKYYIWNHTVQFLTEEELEALHKTDSDTLFFESLKEAEADPRVVKER